jgi:hypothetical protein
MADVVENIEEVVEDAQYDNLYSDYEGKLSLIIFLIFCHFCRPHRTRSKNYRGLKISFYDGASTREKVSGTL